MYKCTKIDIFYEKSISPVQVYKDWYYLGVENNTLVQVYKDWSYLEEDITPVQVY